MVWLMVWLMVVDGVVDSVVDFLVVDFKITLLIFNFGYGDFVNIFRLLQIIIIINENNTPKKSLGLGKQCC